MAEKKFGFNKQCKACVSLFKDGTEVRPKIETLKAEGCSAREIILYCERLGVNLSQLNVLNHFKKHATYVQKGTKLSPKTTRAITMLTRSSEESSSALKKIIAMGSEMIDNWWNKVEGPQMPVTPKIFIEAIKEEGKRSPKTALDTEFENLQKSLIEGEVIDAKQLTP